MKRGLSDFEKAIFLMVGAIGRGKPFWFFPKPVVVKASTNPPNRREQGITNMKYH